MTERLARVVADADVLAADVLVGDEAREALDVVRAHTCLTLLASDALLADAEAIITETASVALAEEWRQAVEKLVESVEHPAGDHPALATAYRGEAGHLLTFDENLSGARAGTAIKRQVEVSVKTPAAFLHTFDPEAAYEVAFEKEYAGPDRDPRR